MINTFTFTWAQLARPPGCQEFQDPVPFLFKVVPDLLCLQAGTESGQCSDWSEERSGACSAASEA